MIVSKFRQRYGIISKSSPFFFPYLPLLFFSPLPPDFPARLFSLPDSSQLRLSFRPPLNPEAETCGRAASCRRPPSIGGPATLSRSGCTSRRPPGGSAPFLQRWAGHVSVQAAEGREDFCQRSADFRGWYVRAMSGLRKNSHFFPPIA